MLAEYWTCVSWNPESRWNGILPPGLRQQLLRRALPEPLRPLVHHSPMREAGRMLAEKLGWKFPTHHERSPFHIDAVFRSLDRRVARRLASGVQVNGVYAYEDAAASTFEAARERGIACLYDLPIGYWRVAHQILTEEAEREPEWACTMSGIRDTTAKLERKDRELALADTILVASSFTRQTIQAAPQAPAKVFLIPYGSPPAIASREKSRSGGPLRVLFAGSLGQRKGVGYLLKAAALLGSRIELTLFGKKISDECAPLNDALRRFRWIPSLPHAELLREMRNHDVFVFPSLFEGFGLVILEAMSQGLVVITTPHTGGPDVIADGQDGFIVPIRSVDAIVEKLELLAADQAMLAGMQEAARKTAEQRTWSAYRRRLVEVVRESLKT